MAIRTEETAFEGKNLAYSVNETAFVILNCSKFRELGFILFIIIIIFIGQANKKGRKAWNNSVTQKDFFFLIS